MKTSKTSGMILGAALSVGAMLSSTAASADTLSQALKWAYENSPTLSINRAALRAADEAVAQARSARLPEITASLRSSLSQSTNSVRDTTDVHRADLDASLLLYDGGQTFAAVQSAKSGVASARSALQAVEQTVLLSAIEAYVNVRRDMRFVELARNNVSVIGQQVAAARDRFEVGEVTRTDVSQADARLASARSNLATNQGAFQRSLQAYVVAVGRPAENLVTPPSLPQLPNTLEEAQAIAKRSHPSIQSAQYEIQAAQFDVDRANAAKGPTVSLGANVSHGENIQVFGRTDTTGSVSLSGSMPLYDGGNRSSLVRSAMASLDRRKAELQDVARTVEQNTALAWSNLNVARASIISSRQQIQAARIAFEGIREEAKLGARTTLDVLDAEQEVLNAESGLATAQRDEYVAAYNLISSMGLLTTDYMNLDVERYDPSAYYQKVNNRPLSQESSTLQRINNRWKN